MSHRPKSSGRKASRAIVAMQVLSLAEMLVIREKAQVLCDIVERHNADLRHRVDKVRATESVPFALVSLARSLWSLSTMKSAATGLEHDGPETAGKGLHDDDLFWANGMITSVMLLAEALSINLNDFCNDENKEVPSVTVGKLGDFGLKSSIENTRTMPILSDLQVLSALQREIWKHLAGQALTADQLVVKLDVSRSTLFARGGISELVTLGLIKNVRVIGGYYRPDAPPRNDNA